MRIGGDLGDALKYVYQCRVDIKRPQYETKSTVIQRP